MFQNIQYGLCTCSAHVRGIRYHLAVVDFRPELSNMGTNLILGNLLSFVLAIF